MHSACQPFIARPKLMGACHLKYDTRNYRGQIYSEPGKCVSRKWNWSTEFLVCAPSGVSLRCFHWRGRARCRVPFLMTETTRPKHLCGITHSLRGIGALVWDTTARVPPTLRGGQAERYVAAVLAFFDFFSAPLACSSSFFDLRDFFSAFSSIASSIRMAASTHSR